ncbi:Uncharacterised protein [Mycobacteroides abscessus subsp. abscessus]|nr:Uncharacterised protein [Mycobacteroides abscessus subsp. abscessus]
MPFAISCRTPLRTSKLLTRARASRQETGENVELLHSPHTCPQELLTEVQVPEKLIHPAQCVSDHCEVLDRNNRQSCRVFELPAMCSMPPDLAAEIVHHHPKSSHL